MNAQNAHEYLPLIYALANGKTIQIKATEWEDFEEYENIEFDADPSCYRIKPEPRTFEMWLASSGVMYPEKLFDNGKPYERITVQEVLK
jgi:hypothetical protein